jgi:TIR domain
MARNGKSKVPVSKVTGFISYSHNDRKYGADAKAVLSDIGIESFLAHDDLDVSEEWRERIIEELKRCDIFVPLISANFLDSKWAPQEVGFIISPPEVAIIPISLDGTVPFGFISHIHARTINEGGITRELLVKPLAQRIPRKIVPCLIRSVSEAPSFNSAEARMSPLLPIFSKMTAEEAQALAEASVSNNQIWSARRCRNEYLPAFIDAQEHNIEAETLKALRYQIKRKAWYIPDEDS